MMQEKAQGLHCPICTLLSNIHFYKCQHFLGSTAVQTECEVSLGFKSTKHGAASQENSCEAVQKLIRKSQIALDLAEGDAAEKVDGIAPLPKEVFLQCGDLYTCSLMA